MKKKSLLMTVVVAVFVLSLVGACAPKPDSAPAPGAAPTPAPAPEVVPPPRPETSPEVATGLARLTPNPVEASMPIYGGILTTTGSTPTSFDAHRKLSFQPAHTLPAFNKLVTFDLAYQETVTDTIIGDLAESWETSPDGTEITFKLHQGVKWHDGMPCTAEDVVYSLDKLTDVNRSGMVDWFPAYQSAEKIDDYTVKVHLKYASAGFMLALAEPYSQIQAKHLAGTDDQTMDFVVGTGPFIITDYKTRIHTKWQRNPDYFKKDKYGNQLPYLDGLNLLRSGGQMGEMYAGRRLDITNLYTSGTSLEGFQETMSMVPETLYVPLYSDKGLTMHINLNHKPLDDIRVRRALGLMVDEASLIIGYSGDPMFGIQDIGILSPSYGLPKEEIRQLMGWDKPMTERVAEAQKLMAEAGYPDGFKLNMMTTGTAGATSGGYVGASMVFLEALRQNLKIDSELFVLSGTEFQKRLQEDNYDMYSRPTDVGADPVKLTIYFSSNGYENWSHYANPEMDRMLSELDHIIDAGKRQETIWEIERTMLTDMPALPTGCFPTKYIFYYPHVKNLRLQQTVYSDALRLEEVWIDPSLKPAGFGTD